MPIVVENVTGRPDPDGESTYVVRVNEKYVAHFVHERRAGLAACLRAAADAVDAQGSDGRAPVTARFGSG